MCACDLFVFSPDRMVFVACVVSIVHCDCVAFYLVSMLLYSSCVVFVCFFLLVLYDAHCCCYVRYFCVRCVVVVVFLGSFFVW